MQRPQQQCRFFFFIAQILLRCHICYSNYTWAFEFYYFVTIYIHFLGCSIINGLVCLFYSTVQSEYVFSGEKNDFYSSLCVRNVLATREKNVYMWESQTTWVPYCVYTSSTAHMTQFRDFQLASWKNSNPSLFQCSSTSFPKQLHQQEHLKTRRNARNRPIFRPRSDFKDVAME